MDEGNDQIFQGPDGTALRFFTQPVKNNFHSERLGRPVYDTVLLVEVMVPASRESTPQFELERTLSEEAGVDENGNRQVLRSDKYDKYKTQVEAYKSQSDASALQGQPLTQWPQIDAGTAATLRAAGVFTIEQLADVSDGNLQKLGIGGRTLRDQAKAYLSTRTFGVPTAQMSAEITHLREQNELLTQQNVTLQAQLAALTSAAPVAPLADPAPVVDIPADNMFAAGTPSPAAPKAATPKTGKTATAVI